jgi:hypothetical protein
VKATKVGGSGDREEFQMIFDNNVQVLAAFVSGTLHGHVLVFEQWFGQTNLSMVGYYSRGHLVGPVWKLMEENGFLVAEDFRLTGEGLYIYPGDHSLSRK